MSTKQTGNFYDPSSTERRELVSSPRISDYLFSKLGIAVMASLVIGIALYVINPPITQRKSDDPGVSEKQDFGKVLIFVTIVLLAVYLLPDVFSRLQKTKKEK